MDNNKEVKLSQYETNDLNRWTVACIAAAVTQRSAHPTDLEWQNRIASHLGTDKDALPDDIPDDVLTDIAKKIQPPSLDQLEQEYNGFVERLVHICLGLLPIQDGKSNKNKLKQPTYSPVDRTKTLYLLRCLRYPQPALTLAQVESKVAQYLYTLYVHRDEIQEQPQEQQQDNEQHQAASGSGSTYSIAASKMSSLVQTAKSARHASRSKITKWATVGAGFIVGGVLIGVTGGLAAPLLAPILVTASGGALGFLVTSGGIVLIGTLFGLSGGGLVSYRLNRRFKDIQEFEFHPIKPIDQEQKQEQQDNNHKHVQTTTSNESSLPPTLEASHPELTVVIVVSGLLRKNTDYIEPWYSAFVNSPSDVFALKWEVQDMVDLGKSFNSFTRDLITKKGAAEVVKRTALSAFYTAVSLPSTIYTVASYTLDNIFQRSITKARQAGILLADTIEKQVQGPRPVKLVGSSVGALVVFTCLLELAKRNPEKCYVNEAVLISLPTAPSVSEWERARSACADRIVNVYSRKDWLLAVVARLHSFGRGVAGLGPVNLDKNNAPEPSLPTPPPTSPPSESAAAPASVPNNNSAQNLFADNDIDNSEKETLTPQSQSQPQSLSQSEEDFSLMESSSSSFAKIDENNAIPDTIPVLPRPRIMNVNVSKFLGGHSELTDPEIVKKIITYIQLDLARQEGDCI